MELPSINELLSWVWDKAQHSFSYIPLPSHIFQPHLPHRRCKNSTYFPLFGFVLAKILQHISQTLTSFCFDFLFVCILTVLAGLDIQDVAADPVSSLCVGQHLNTVVGELLKPSQLHLFTCGGDILHLSPLWGGQEGKTVLESTVCNLVDRQHRLTMAPTRYIYILTCFRSVCLGGKAITAWMLDCSCREDMWVDGFL